MSTITRFSTPSRRRIRKRRARRCVGIFWREAMPCWRWSTPPRHARDGLRLSAPQNRRAHMLAQGKRGGETRRLNPKEIEETGATMDVRVAYEEVCGRFAGAGYFRANARV